MAAVQEAPAADATTTTTAAATAPAAASSSSPIQANTTVLSTLHNLLRAHVAAHPSPTQPYLHPYAPLPASAWKGKAKAELLSQPQQADALQAIRKTLEGAKAVLGKRENDRLRLTRAMKEVVNHETALLPLGTTLSSLPPARRIPLSPKGTSDLLYALAKRLGLQCFAEEAGGQKTTLTLAGERFVVDVDIETGSDGKVTIHKLTATHIMPNGETGKSEWIERVMRRAIDHHTSLWNERQGNDDKLRASGRAIECLLGELKMLDDLAVRDKSGIDYFAELETLTSAVEEKVKGTDEKARIYPDPNQGIFPSFRLFDGGVNGNPTLRLRPTLQGESVSLPPLPESQAAGDGAVASGNAMDVDSQPVLGICKGLWALEAVDEYPEPCSSGRGIVVRRTWAVPGPEDSESKAWSASMKAEGLVYQGAVEAMGMAALPIFPYNTDFVHPTTGLKQHWSMGHPGPEGFVVGRFAVPRTWEAIGNLCSALRVQAVLNELITAAFPPSKLKGLQNAQQPENGEVAADGDDTEMADLAELEGARSDIPISAMLFQQSMRVSMPLSEDDNGALLLEVQATPEPPYVSVSWRVDDGVAIDEATRGRLDSAVAGAKSKGPADLIDIVRDVAGALTSS